MLTMSATEVRKDWSRVLDSVTRRRPAFIKRTHDNVVLASTESLSAMLSYWLDCEKNNFLRTDCLHIYRT